MSKRIDQEIEAIKTILTSLEPLDDLVRKNVLDYILKRIKFDYSVIESEVQSSKFSGNYVQEASPTSEPEVKEIHIKQFKETKRPRSAIEMASIVAYYLQYHAEADDKKDKVGTADLDTQFKIADYPLQKGDMKFLLVNTKNAGYFDSVGNGEYKLNAVGYNLIKHNLPRKDGKATTKRPRKTIKKVVKKTPKKSTKK